MSFLATSAGEEAAGRFAELIEDNFTGETLFDITAQYDEIAGTPSPGRLTMPR
jgi:hypothetical protein